MNNAIKFAADCIPCPDGCGEPWCADCQKHYADCACRGPTTEDDDGTPQTAETKASKSRLSHVQAAEGREGSEKTFGVGSSKVTERKTNTLKGVNVSDILVVTSKVKAIAKAKDIRTGEEFITKLSEKVQTLVDEAITKAVAAERKTLKAEDLG